MIRTRSMATSKAPIIHISNSSGPDFFIPYFWIIWGRISSSCSQVHAEKTSPQLQEFHLQKVSFKSLESFTLEDMHRFWGVEQKKRYDCFKNRSVVSGWVINLEQLEDSHWSVSFYFRAQKLSSFFQLCGLEVYEKPVRLFYANLRTSKDKGEPKTLVLENPIIVNEFLFDVCLELSSLGLSFLWLVAGLRILKCRWKLPRLKLLNPMRTYLIFVLCLYVLKIKFWLI